MTNLMLMLGQITAIILDIVPKVLVPTIPLVIMITVPAQDVFVIKRVRLVFLLV